MLSSSPVAAIGPRHLPKYLWIMFAAYLLASLAHFAHNAEFIVFYPNLPSWLTREHVYFAWLAITGIGVLGLAVTRTRWRTVGVALMGLYGAFGLDGLAHYTLALCGEHTLVANVTIWSEAIAGVLLLLACAVLVTRRLTLRPR